MGKQWQKSRRTRDGGRIRVTKFGPNKSNSGCFPASALVLTPGGWKPISSFEVGDHVLSFCRLTGAMRTRTVTRRIDHSPRPIWAIETTDSARKIESTIGHPFLTQRGWVRAFQLRAGDQLTVAGPTKYQSVDVVIAARRTSREEAVHNLHTTGENNFIVSGVVAHNFSVFRNLRGWLHNIRHELAQKFPLLSRPRPATILADSLPTRATA
jgi:hypothetical protein